MSDLDEAGRALIALADDAHDPTDMDRARVRAALARRLGAAAGLGLGAVAGVGATAKAAAGAGTVASAGGATTAVAGSALAMKLMGIVAITTAVGVGAGIKIGRRSVEPGAAAKISEVHTRRIAAPLPAPAPPPLPALALAPAREQSTIACGAGELCSPRNVAGGFGRGQGGGPHPSPPISIEEVPPAKPIVQPAPRHEPRRNEASPIKAPPHEAPSEAPPAATTPPPALETPAATTAASDPCAPAQTSQSGVAGEARLVTDGVRARRSGRSACALSLLDTHARAFPEGVLAEERDAERALALAALGRTAEARTAATAFLRKYPASLLGARLRHLADASR